jgi:hypothetical protein
MNAVTPTSQMHKWISTFLSNIKMPDQTQKDAAY